MKKLTDEVFKKLDSKLQEKHVDTLLARLKDSEIPVRRAAMEVFARLDESLREKHIDAMLAHDDFVVRSAAVECFGDLKTSVRERHVQKLLPFLEEETQDTRSSALEV